MSRPLRISGPFDVRDGDGTALTGQNGVLHRHAVECIHIAVLLQVVLGGVDATRHVDQQHQLKANGRRAGRAGRHHGSGTEGGRNPVFQFHLFSSRVE